MIADRHLIFFKGLYTYILVIIHFIISDCQYEDNCGQYKENSGQCREDSGHSHTLYSQVTGNTESRIS